MGKLLLAVAVVFVGVFAARSIFSAEPPKPGAGAVGVKPPQVRLEPFDRAKFGTKVHEAIMAVGKSRLAGGNQSARVTIPFTISYYRPRPGEAALPEIMPGPEDWPCWALCLDGERYPCFGNCVSIP